MSGRPLRFGSWFLHLLAVLLARKTTLVSEPLVFCVWRVQWSPSTKEHGTVPGHGACLWHVLLSRASSICVELDSVLKIVYRNEEHEHKMTFPYLLWPRNTDHRKCTHSNLWFWARHHYHVVHYRWVGSLAHGSYISTSSEEISQLNKNIITLPWKIFMTCPKC